MRKLGYFESALESSKGISMIQPRTMVRNNTVYSPETPLASNDILMKTETNDVYVVGDWLLNLSEHFLLLYFLTRILISIHKELQSC